MIKNFCDRCYREITTDSKEPYDIAFFKDCENELFEYKKRDFLMLCDTCKKDLRSWVECTGDYYDPDRGYFDPKYRVPNKNYGGMIYEDKENKK